MIPTFTNKFIVITFIQFLYFNEIILNNHTIINYS